MAPVIVPIGTYLPGHSLLHRCPAGIMIVSVLVFIVAVVILGTTLLRALAALGVAGLCYLIARIPLRTSLRTILPVLPLLALLGVFQWWTRGMDYAITMVLGLLATIFAAALITLTCTMEEILSALDHGLSPLKAFGVPTQRISLAMMLMIRLIPLLATTVSNAMAARSARGLRWSVAALAVPVLVTSIRRAEVMGHALIGRGLGDEDD